VRAELDSVSGERFSMADFASECVTGAVCPKYREHNTPPEMANTQIVSITVFFITVLVLLHGWLLMRRLSYTLYRGRVSESICGKVIETDTPTNVGEPLTRGILLSPK